MAAERWRLFVAVPLGDDLRRDLTAQLAPVRANAPGGLRWIDPDAWHMTLAFLGDTDPQRVPALEDSLRSAVAAFRPFTASIARIGAFPRASSARIVWLGVDGGEELRRLAAAVAEACGVKREEPFRGHITIARWRGHHRVTAELLDSRVEAPLPVRDVQLLRSVQTATGHEYQLVTPARLAT